MENIQPVSPPTSEIVTSPQSKGVYSIGEMVIAAFFAGPFVSGYLASENHKELGDKNSARIVMILGILLSLLLIGLPVFIIHVLHKPVNSTINLGYFLGMMLTVGQGDKIKSYLEKGGKKRHQWPTACIVFTVLIYTIFTLSIIGHIVVKKHTPTDSQVQDFLHTVTVDAQNWIANSTNGYGGFCESESKAIHDFTFAHNHLGWQCAMQNNAFSVTIQRPSVASGMDTTASKYFCIDSVHGTTILNSDVAADYQHLICPN